MIALCLVKYNAVCANEKQNELLYGVAYYYEYMFISSSGTINSVSEYGKYVYRKDIQMLYMDVTNTTSQLGEMEKTAECILSGNGSFRMGELIYKRK